MDTNLEKIQQQIAGGDTVSGLETLSRLLQREKRYAEWFEALKMMARHDLGLPVWAGPDDAELSLEQSRQLEDRLVEACRVVGEQMVADGHIREGWMYLRPVGDPQRARELLQSLKIDDENADSIIEVAIGNGVCPAWGYQLLLERMGTCNAITTFDTQMQSTPLDQRQEAAADLTRQLHRELLSGLQYGLSQDEPLATESVPEVLKQHPELLSEGAYHVDPSHLASVVRIARIVDIPDVQEMAWELACYGERLSESLQPEPSAPFEPYFESHRLYFEVLLGKDTHQRALAHFRKQRHLATREVQDPGYSFGLEKQFETTEILVELLVRTGQFQEANQVLLDQLANSSEHQKNRWSMMLFDCCRRSGDFEPLQSFGSQQNDPLGFTLACLYSRQPAN